MKCFYSSNGSYSCNNIENFSKIINNVGPPTLNVGPQTLDEATANEKREFEILKTIENKIEIIKKKIMETNNNMNKLNIEKDNNIIKLQEQIKLNESNSMLLIGDLEYKMYNIIKDLESKKGNITNDINNIKLENTSLITKIYNNINNLNSNLNFYIPILNKQKENYAKAAKYLKDFNQAQLK